MEVALIPFWRPGVEQDIGLTVLAALMFVAFLKLTGRL
jgi:hypothetical protein